MLSETITKALNEQVKNELFSANLYLAMAICFDRMGLKGLSSLYFKHFEEEQGHGMKMLKYIMEAGGEARVLAIPEPTATYASAEEMLQVTLNHEKAVTKMIDDLAALAEQEGDRATRSFLNWYIDEQVEEEALFGQLLQWAQMAGPAQIFMLDGRVAQMAD